MSDRSSQLLHAGRTGSGLNGVNSVAAVAVAAPLNRKPTARHTAAPVTTSSRCPPAALLQVDVAAFVSAAGWTVQGNMVCPPLGPENTPRAKKAVEEATTAIKYSDVAPLVGMLARQ